MDSFRRVNPAASLKRDAGHLVLRRILQRFRRVNPAASLKHTPASAAPAPARRRFPPGKSGGLIEAARSPELNSAFIGVSAG